jgi:hypothetical protein
LPFTTQAQLENVIFQDSILLRKNKNPSIGIEFSPFLRNNEYFQSSQDGETFIGYQLQGLFIYPLHKKVELHLGGLAVQNYGNQNGFSSWFPVARLRMFHQKSEYIVGTINGAVNHQLIEPLFEQERMYYERNENGFQWRRQTEKSFMDAWLDWEVNTGRNINRQERFTVGFNYKPSLNLGSKQQFIPNVQAIYQHSGPSNGGSNAPLRTLVNGAVGAEWNMSHGDRKLRLLSYFLMFQDFSINPSLSFENGNGHYHTIQYSPNKKWDFLVNYWQGIEWHSSIGGRNYMAVNPFDRRFPRRNKSLLFLRAHYHKRILNSIDLDARIEPYADLNEFTIEPSFSLHLKFWGVFSGFATKCN